MTVRLVIEDTGFGLRAAARVIRGAATGGFTPAVATEAAGFTEAWQRLAAETGQECEQRADALRATVADLAATDRAVAEALT